MTRRRYAKAMMCVGSTDVEADSVCTLHVPPGGAGVVCDARGFLTSVARVALR